MTFFDTGLFIATFTTVLVIADPAGNLPVFIALTSRMTPRERATAAFQATLTSLAVLTIFGLFGRMLLDVLSISVQAMQISGGLLLLIVALQLLTGHEEDPGQPGTVNVALVPLGIPLMAGPGSIVAVMLAAGDAVKSGVGGIIAAIVAVLAVHLIEWLVFRFANPVHRMLGEAGTIFVTKISGMLLAAIAVQLIVNGVVEIFKAI